MHMLRLTAATTGPVPGFVRHLRTRLMYLAWVCALFLCCASDLFAQAPPDRTVTHRNVLWMTANSVLRTNRHWGLLADASHRRSDLARANDLTLLRIAPGYWITQDLSVAAGYAHLWSTTSGASGEITLNENRLHQQLIYVLHSGRSSFNGRIRIEERWREGTLNGLPSKTFNYTTRYRLLVGYRQPLSHASHAPQILLAEEIMLHSGESVRHGMFEQNRLFAGIQWKLSKTLNLETGYMYTWQKLLPENTYQSIHTIRLTLSYERKAPKEPHPETENFSRSH